MQNTLRALITACAVVGVIACFSTCEMKRYEVNKEIRLNVATERAIQ